MGRAWGIITSQWRKDLGHRGLAWGWLSGAEAIGAARGRGQQGRGWQWMPPALGSSSCHASFPCSTWEAPASLPRNCPLQRFPYLVDMAATPGLAPETLVLPRGAELTPWPRSALPPLLCS